VFGLAFAMLALSGVLLWRARTLPCPADPALAMACVRLRRASVVLWWVALACTTLGAAFAFALPLLG
jgi:membrane protein YqaA with SNARE-associated domain